MGDTLRETKKQTKKKHENYDQFRNRKIYSVYSDTTNCLHRKNLSWSLFHSLKMISFCILLKLDPPIAHASIQKLLSSEC